MRPLDSRFILLGAGGHGRVLLETLIASGLGDRILGVVDADPEAADWLPEGIPFLGGDAILDAHPSERVELVNGMGSVDRIERRMALFDVCRDRGFFFATVLHPSAIVAGRVTFWQGVQVMAGAVVQTGCVVGDNVLINTRAVVEHDCHVGPHCHIASGAVLCGEVRVDQRVHVGAGATIIQGVHIGTGAIIGAGALVRQDVSAGVTVVGVPAREVKRG